MLRMRFFFRRALPLLCAAVWTLGFGAYHRTPLNESSDTNGLSAFTVSNAPLRQVSADVFALGLVRLDKKNRTISFPGVVNMAEGLVEYAVVHETGKVHESVLKTPADPLHIHLARLLLGSAAPITTPGKKAPPELLGLPITIRVRWDVNGTRRQASLEDLVSNTLTKARMAEGDWIYNGSRVVQGTFLAQRDGSIVSVIADPDALVNNPRPGREDDEIWKVNDSVVPAVGTAVEITFELATRRE
jgi:hypothetical protein